MLLNVSELKSRNTRMISRLKKLGVDIKHTQGLEGLAAAENFSDWNKYEAHLRNQAKESPTSSSPFTWTQPRFLALPPGSGKSTILQMLSADCISRGKSVLYIDCGTGVYADMPSFLINKCQLVSLRRDVDGNTQVNAFSTLTATPLKLLELDIRQHIREGEELGVFVSLAVDKVKAICTPAFLSTLGLVVIDEFHQLPLQTGMAQRVLVNTLLELGAPLIVGSQEYPSKMLASSIDWRVITRRSMDYKMQVFDQHPCIFVEDYVNLPPSFTDELVLPEAYSVYAHMALRGIKYGYTLANKEPLLAMFETHHREQLNQLSTRFVVR